MRIRHLLLSGLAAAIAAGCTIEVDEVVVGDGGGDAGGGDAGDDGAGFFWSWAIADAADDDVSYTCEEAGATWAGITVEDSAGDVHVYSWPCGDWSAGSPDWDVATGAGHVTAELLDEDEVALDAVLFDFDFVFGRLPNDFGLVRFRVSP